MNCLECRKSELEEQFTDMATEVKGESVLVTGIKALVCPLCGFKTIHLAGMSEYMRLASDVYRARHGLLTSMEIRERRDRTGKPQEEFARYLGVGVASIKRWELGHVQDPAMDKLIRIHTDSLEAYQHYEAVSRVLSRPVHF